MLSPYAIIRFIPQFVVVIANLYEETTRATAHQQMNKNGTQILSFFRKKETINADFLVFPLRSLRSPRFIFEGGSNLLSTDYHQSYLGQLRRLIGKRKIFAYLGHLMPEK